MTAPVPQQQPLPGPEGANGQGAPSPHRPLPPGVDMEVWKRIVDGAPERVLRIVEQESAAQIEIQRAEALRRVQLDQHQMRMDIVHFRFRVAGAVFGATAFAAILLLAKHFIDEGALAPAAGVLSAAAAAIGALVFGAKKGK
ncbi:hypothetical protein ACGFYP_12370 [Streptomyces sp. NPDC048370]|uniref:hypothetical protein n=1 Tax=Streptomyces sp. NPDC048370 TaxID=3365540 RepID=UPI00372095CC